MKLFLLPFWDKEPIACHQVKACQLPQQRSKVVLEVMLFKDGKLLAEMILLSHRYFFLKSTFVSAFFS